MTYRSDDTPPLRLTRLDTMCASSHEHLSLVPSALGNELKWVSLIYERSCIPLTQVQNRPGNSKKQRILYLTFVTTMKSKICFAVVATLLFTTGTSLKACFYPDGKNATGLIPCRPDAETSHCCREADACLSNGMCFSPGLGSLVRRACTDQTWKSADCPNVCTTGKYCITDLDSMSSIQCDVEEHTSQVQSHILSLRMA